MYGTETYGVQDYIGYDDLRKRLSAIVDMASGASRSVQRLSDPSAIDELIRPDRPARTDPVLAGKRVLVADDEETFRHTIRDVLVGCGCDVQLVADGEQAKQRLRREHFDLILSDINMPRASGYEVFTEARRISPDTPVILITAFGYDPKHSIVRARAEGLSALLWKPFKVNKLLDACRTAVQNTPE